MWITLALEYLYTYVIRFNCLLTCILYGMATAGAGAVAVDKSSLLIVIEIIEKSV
jgi:hypothetical protein